MTSCASSGREARADASEQLVQCDRSSEASRRAARRASTERSSEQWRSVSWRSKGRASTRRSSNASAATDECKRREAAAGGDCAHERACARRPPAQLEFAQSAADCSQRSREQRTFSAIGPHTPHAAMKLYLLELRRVRHDTSEDVGAHDAVGHAEAAQSVPSLARLAASGARSTSARTCESGWLAGAAADDATAARRSSLCAKSCSRMGAGSESLSHTSGSWPSRSRRRQVPSAAHASDVGRAARMAASMSSGKPSSVSGGSSSAAHERRTALSPLAPPPKPIMRRLSGAS
eukprot:scaffold148899_cov28-Tisochrysis_lutea.AAC.3